MVEVNNIEGNLVSIPDYRIEQNKELEKIYKTNYTKFKRIASKFRLPPELQEDIIQNAFLSALRTERKIDKIESCMNQSVFNAGLLFKKNKFEKLRTAFNGNFERYTTKTAETELLQRDEIRYLNLSVEKLSKQQRNAIKLGIMENLGSKVTGERMGINLNTAKAHWRWGIMNLRKEIKTWDIPETHESEYYIMEDKDAY